MTGVPRVALGDLVTITGGGTPLRSNPAYFDGDIPWVTPKDMKAPELCDSQVRITERGLRESATKLVPPGSVLVVVRSGVLKHSVPIAINRVPVALNQDMKALSPGPRLQLGYLAHYLRARTPEILRWVRSATHGAGDNFPVERLRKLELPLPPLAEQQRVAAILDCADRLRAKRRQAVALLDALGQSTCLALCGDALATRRPLGEALAAPSCYGTMIPANGTGSHLCLRVKNISSNRLTLADAKYVDLPSKDVGRHTVREGDLLMARAIGSLDHLGKCVVVETLNEPTAFDSHLMRIRLDGRRLLPAFLQAWLSTPDGRAAFLGIARRSAVQFNVNTKEMASFAVPMPGIEKQRRVAQALERVSAARRRMDQSLATLDGLFASLRHRAFRGEL